jgi:hypothetical protein
MGEIKTLDEHFLGKFIDEERLYRPRRKWEDSFKIRVYLVETRCGNVNFTELLTFRTLSIALFLAYFHEVGLCDLHAVCVCESHLSIDWAQLGMLFPEDVDMSPFFEELFLNKK